MLVFTILVVSLDVVVTMMVVGMSPQPSLQLCYSTTPPLLFDSPLLKQGQVFSGGRRDICVQGKKPDTGSMLRPCGSAGSDGLIEQDRHPSLHEGFNAISQQKGAVVF